MQYDEQDIAQMVSRFLAWPLPADFAPDGGITAARPNYAPEVEWRPVGTNLFTAAQAAAMIRHILATPPASDAAVPARPVMRMEVIREWVGGERYARDYEYCDATFKDQADRVLALFAAAPKVASDTDEHGDIVTIAYMMGARDERDRHAKVASDTGPGWIVGNNVGQWRTFDSFGWAWTDRRDLAVRYARREDAELVHGEDEDSWRVERYPATPTDATDGATGGGEVWS